MLLPAELISRIIQETPKSTMTECLLVCQQWYSITSRLYYRHIELSLNHVLFLKAAEKMGYHVRNLVFLYKDHPRTRTKDDSYLDLPQFCRLISLLPSLETIQLNAPCAVPFSHYLQYLKQVPRCHLPHLQDILLSTPIHNQQVHKDYVSNIQLSSNTIARARLNTSMPSWLPLMKQLKHLSLHGVDLGSVLNACHDGLESLEVSDVKLTTSLSSKYFGRLTRFCMSGTALTDDLVDTMTNSIPLNLEYLQLDMKKVKTQKQVSHIQHAKHANIKMTGAWQYVDVGLLEIVLFHGITRTESVIRGGGAAANVKFALDMSVQGIPNEIDTNTLLVQSHVAHIKMHHILPLISRRYDRRLQVQCFTGSLEIVDGAFMNMTGALSESDMGYLSQLYPKLEEIRVDANSSSSSYPTAEQIEEAQRMCLQLATFEYVRQVCVCVDESTRFIISQGQKKLNYYCHEGQVVSCSEKMDASFVVEILLGQFEELQLMFKNKVVHVFRSEFM